MIFKKIKNKYIYWKQIIIKLKIILIKLTKKYINELN